MVILGWQIPDISINVICYIQIIKISAIMGCLTLPSYGFWHKLLFNGVIMNSLVRMHSVTQVAVGYLAFSV